MTTGGAVYFDSKLRKLKLQTYQTISPAVTEKPPANVENRESGVWREGKFPSLAENAAQKRSWATLNDIYIPDDGNSPDQVLGIVTSQASKNMFLVDKIHLN